PIIEETQGLFPNSWTQKCVASRRPFWTHVRLSVAPASAPRTTEPGSTGFSLWSSKIAKQSHSTTPAKDREAATIQRPGHYRQYVDPSVVIYQSARLLWGFAFRRPPAGLGRSFRDGPHALPRCGLDLLHGEFHILHRRIDDAAHNRSKALALFLLCSPR